jgi:hypothetical protein
MVWARVARRLTGEALSRILPSRFVDSCKELPMRVSPVPERGLFNGWLLAAIFYLFFGILLLLFPKRVVSRLYDRSGQRGASLVRRVLGLLLFLAWLLLAILILQPQLS